MVVSYGHDGLRRRKLCQQRGAPAPLDRIRQLARDPFAVGLAALLLLAFAWFEWVTWTQYQSNRVFLADAGKFDFICSGLRHGNFLREPLYWNLDVNYFAGHFRPVLLLLMPLYFLADGAMTFLTAMNAAIVLGALPLTLFARDLLRSRALALAVAAAYLSNHFTASLHLAIHPESLALPGMFGMFLAVQRRRPVLYGACMAWALLAKEDYAIWTGLFGLSLLVEPQRDLRRWALATVAAAVAWWVIAHAAMHASGAPLLRSIGDQPLSRFASMGDTKGEVLLHMATHPLAMAGRLFAPALLAVLASTAFLALADWRAFWLTIASAGVFIVTDDPLVSDLAYYYSYPAIPFLFYNTVRGMANVCAARRVPPETAARVLTILFALVALASVPLRTRTDGYRRFGFPVTDHHRLLPEVADNIPPDAPVAVQYDLYARVSNRPVKLPLRLAWLDDVEWVLLDVNGRMSDLVGEEKREEREELFRRLESPEFETVLAIDGYVVLRRPE